MQSFMQENNFVNIVYKMAAIVYRNQCIDQTVDRWIQTKELQLE